MFIDYLTLIMINLVAGSALLAYYILTGLDADDPRPHALGLGIVGLLGLILGLVLTLTWPLPGAYNIAFGESTVLFGVIFLASAIAIYKRWSLTPVTIFAFFGGIYAAIVGFRIISLELTKEPIMSAIGFILAGAGGIFAYPALILMKKYRLIRYAGVAFMLGIALLWAVTFYGSLWGHMESFGSWVPLLMRGGQ